jgi:1-acyl-sn-glycerol-3-phosphate acyltransferase
MIRKKINYWWRIAKAGFCFFVFGIGSLIIASTILPVIAVSSKCHDKKSKRARMAIYLSWRFFVFLMSICDSISVKIKNFEKLKNIKGQIIVANHPSLIDVVILISCIPQADCIVKGSLAENFFMKNIIKSLYIVNSLDFEKVLSKCDESLKKGHNLIVFPEGTRTVPGQKSQISRGTAHIAIQTHSNILPIRINCNPPGLLKNQKWHHVPEKRMEYVLEVKDLIKIDEFINNKADKPIMARRLTDKFKEALEI